MTPQSFRLRPVNKTCWERAKLILFVWVCVFNSNTHWIGMWEKQSSYWWWRCFFCCWWWWWIRVSITPPCRSRFLQSERSDHTLESPGRSQSCREERRIWWLKTKGRKEESWLIQEEANHELDPTSWEEEGEAGGFRGTAPRPGPPLKISRERRSG